MKAKAPRPMEAGPAGCTRRPWRRRQAVVWAAAWAVALRLASTPTVARPGTAIKLASVSRMGLTHGMVRVQDGFGGLLCERAKGAQCSQRACGELGRQPDVSMVRGVVSRI